MPAPLRISPATATSKRSRSSDSQRSSSATPVPTLSQCAGDPSDLSLPAFLRQSNAEILQRFDALQREQNQRILQGRHPFSQWAQNATRESKLRNRYVDVWPWAHARIHLKVSEGRSDYINASPICLRCSKTGLERKYIATQGPKQTGLDEFWQMIWHETSEIAVIVMLTQLAEGIREKCYQYYPKDVSSDVLQVSLTSETGEACEGQVEVVESNYDEASKSTVRRLLMTCGGNKKTVWHLLFLGWSDHGVPDHEGCASLLELIKLSKEKNDAPENPRIIHCSAGVGRSGTFIALEHLLAELDVGRVAEAAESEDVVYETVEELRRQRMTMVQSPEQFQYLYDVLRREYQTQQREQRLEAATPEADLSSTEQPSSPNRGEPSPKARKLSRGLTAVFMRDKARAGPAVESSGEGKAPKTP